MGWKNTVDSYKALQTIQIEFPATQKCNHTTPLEEKWFHKNQIRPSLKMGRLPFKISEMKNKNKKPFAIRTGNNLKSLSV